MMPTAPTAHECRLQTYARIAAQYGERTARRWFLSAGADPAVLHRNLIQQAHLARVLAELEAAA